MCDTCGCGSNEYRIFLPGEKKFAGEQEHSHDHDHNHDHGHDHSHDSHSHSHEKVIDVEQDVLAHNRLHAERNRGYFDAKNIIAINFISSPGSGKTTLLEKTFTSLSSSRPIVVIEGDQQSDNDAARIARTGIKAIQINTGNGCHLDAAMVQEAVKKLNIDNNSLLLIENVGNLVCPTLFDLGEKYRMVMISVTEGEDKPEKYPYIFASAHFCIISKTDLLPYVDCNLEHLKKSALRINPSLKFFELSAKTGQGMDAWLQWINSL